MTDSTRRGFFTLLGAGGVAVALGAALPFDVVPFDIVPFGTALALPTRPSWLKPGQTAWPLLFNVTDDVGTVEELHLLVGHPAGQSAGSAAIPHGRRLLGIAFDVSARGPVDIRMRSAGYSDNVDGSLFLDKGAEGYLPGHGHVFASLAWAAEECEVKVRAWAITEAVA